MNLTEMTTTEYCSYHLGLLFVYYTRESFNFDSLKSVYSLHSLPCDTSVVQESRDEDPNDLLQSDDTWLVFGWIGFDKSRRVEWAARWTNDRERGMGGRGINQ